jgi:uncharacterized protein YjbI with pentapeptide repeats
LAHSSPRFRQARRFSGSNRARSFVATKKQLLHRWLEEPGRTIASQIRQILVDTAETLRVVADRAHEATGLYIIPKEWLPPFDTKAIFDLLNGLPHRSEIANGRDLRGIPSIGGRNEWDLIETDFSFLPGIEEHTFTECHLDGAVFDGSQGDFNFLRCPLRKVRFRKVHFRPARHTGGFCGGDCIECDFSNARMKKAHFMEHSDLRGTSFVGADLRWALMARCDLRGCGFRGAMLSGASIQESIIDKTTDFRGANLVGLSWQDRRDNAGNLFRRGSDWRQGTYDSSTIHD